MPDFLFKKTNAGGKSLTINTFQTDNDDYRINKSLSKSFFVTKDSRNGIENFNTMSLGPVTP